jgi:alkylated DNA repair dioxygenase AlkB
MEGRRMKTKKVRPAPPQYENIPNFLTDNRKETFRLITELPGFQAETGSCELMPTHQTLHYGPRQSYLDCVPPMFRVVSSGEAPPFLAAIQTRVEEMLDCTFNSCQLNFHAPDSVVHRHGDSNPGHVCMISLGHEREFVLSYQNPYNMPFTRIPLLDGGLLTLLPQEQFRMCHEMPKLKQPATERRISIIFRYIPQIVTEKMLKTCKSEEEKDAYRIERDNEYQEAQAYGRAARAGMPKNPMYDADMLKQAIVVREREHRRAAATVDYNNRAAAAAIVAARKGTTPTKPEPPNTKRPKPKGR